MQIMFDSVKWQGKNTQKETK